MNIWKSTKVYSFFYGPQSFWKENIVDRVKFWGSNVLKCLEITTEDLRKKGVLK